MTTIRDLDFSGSNNNPINRAIDELVSAFKVATDGGYTGGSEGGISETMATPLDGNLLFPNAKEGNLTTSDTWFLEDEPVGLRICENSEIPSLWVQSNMIVTKKVIISIVPFFQMTVDETNGAERIDWYRRNLKRLAQKVLDSPNFIPNGGATPRTFWFGDQREEAEAEQNYWYEFEKKMPLKDGWYSCPFLKVLYVDVR